jgi:hypothetical protein
MIDVRLLLSPPYNGWFVLELWGVRAEDVEGEKKL